MENIENLNLTIVLKSDKLWTFHPLLNFPSIHLSKILFMTLLASLIILEILTMVITLLNVEIWVTKNGTLSMIHLFMKVIINKIIKVPILICYFTLKNKFNENALFPNIFL